MYVSYNNLLLFANLQIIVKSMLIRSTIYMMAQTAVCLKTHQTAQLSLKYSGFKDT